MLKNQYVPHGGACSNHLAPGGRVSAEKKTVDKPIEDWLRRLRGMDEQRIVAAWEARAKEDLSWTQEPNFHAAAAERMKQLGNMAIDLDDDVRVSLCRRAQSILKRLKHYLRETPELFTPIGEHADTQDDFYAEYGTRTARYYMFEQGVMDELGDRVIGTPRKKGLLKEAG
ncbi:MAG: hypothetical protein AAFO61_05920 [Pseudomonadota bacterium]